MKEDTHLRMVQFILSNDLDSYLSTSLSLDRLVDVRESTITHLLNQSETFQSLQISADLES